MSHAVVIENVVKRYGSFTAVNNISLRIEQGEFFTLLGPSGCGKTTLLRMIAGFNSIDGGTISFDDKVINKVPAHLRDIGMVFQNYAIFPHLNVTQNVAYGLKARHVAQAETLGRVKKALEMVQIDHLASRKPNELSGGQQQRVALARAFVIEPGLLLMDEPLSNLDAKLRVQMRTTIKKLQRSLGITTVYVTHDQEEALAISDRIAVMKDGNIMQIGTPEEIYRKPANPFVANFIGVSNFIEGKLSPSPEGADAAVLELPSGYSMPVKLRRPFSGPVTVSARPEQLFFDHQGIPAKVTMSTFLGDFVQYEAELANGQTVELNEYTKETEDLRSIGEEVYINLNQARISLYDTETEEVLSL